MSDLLDERALEEREEGQEDDGLPNEEEEASYGDSDGSGGSSDDEEEEGDEDKKFIAGEDEEEDEGGEKEGEAEGEEQQRKKKKRRHRELVLEEEDYELLEENTGVRQVRPSGHRRLKKARDMGGEAAQRDAAAALQAELFGEEGGQGLDLEDDMEEPAAPEAEGAAAGDDDGRRGYAGGEGDDFQSSDEDDWIVNEFEEEGQGGAGGRRERRRRGPVDPALAGIDAAALAEAHDIFGDVDELMEIYQASKARAAGGGGGAGAGDEAEEGSDLDDDLDAADLEGLSEDEADEARRARRAERRAEATARRLQRQLEPGAAERHFLLPSDAAIREADVPERETLTRGPDPINFDLDACAEWVVEELERSDDGMIDKARELVEEGVREVEGPPPEWMGVPTWRPLNEEGQPEELLRGGLEDVSSHRGLFEGRRARPEIRKWRENEGAQAALRTAVRAALSRIYEAHEEVPVVGMYRKELLGELLALRGSDEPGESDAATDPLTGERNPLYGVVKAADRRARRWEVLYAVQRLAQRWRALHRAKEAREVTYEAGLASAASEEDRDAVLACLQAIPGVRSMEALDDLDAKFKLAMSVAESAAGAGAAPDVDLAALDLDEEGEEAPRTESARPGASNKPLRLKAATRRGGAAGAARRLALAAGLRPMAEQLGLSAAEFAECIEAGWKTHEPADPSVPPLELAARFVDPNVPVLRDAEQVLRAAGAILEAEIAVQPAVRAAAREFVRRNAVVSTRVTAAGATTLTPFHPLCIAKRLRNKRLRDFDRDTFLRVLQAEEAKLVTVEYALAEGSDDTGALPPDLFLSGGVGPEAQAWNEVRSDILRRVLHGGLLKEALATVRSRLAGDARGDVALQLSEAAWKAACRSPIVLHSEEGEMVAEPRIMAAVWGPGTPPTTLVVLDAQGALVDYLHCPQLSGAIPRPKATPGQVVSSFTDPKKSKDAAAIRAFIESHTPHAIVVGVAHCEALNLKDEIKGVLDQILADNPRVIRSVETGIVVVPAPEGVAALWENCDAAKEELPASAAVVRRGVALAREALEPLAVLAAVAGPGREVLSLPLHPLQTVVPPDERMRVWEEALVTATAQAGVDINAAAAAPWRAAPLAFVPGLGPRKAQTLLRAINRSGGALESRRALLDDLGAMGPAVFSNAAPALRVRASTKAAANLDIVALDDTRVHPESYALAAALAQSAAPGVEEDVAVEHAMAAPEEVKNLELDVYDEHLRGLDAAVAAFVESGDGEDAPAPAPGPAALRGSTRLATLIDTQFELIAPYGELRSGVDANDEDATWSRNPHLLYWATGQDEKALRPGRRLEAKIRWVGSREAKLTVPELNDLEVTLLSGDISSSRDASELDCRDFLQRGNTVMAVVKEVNAEERAVFVATSSKALNSEAHWEAEYLARDEEAYVAPTEKEIAQERAAAAGVGAGAAAAGTKRQVKRRIRHPLFQNLSMADAAAAVRPDAPDADGAATAHPPVGTAIVRPGKSSTGLYITMRMPGDLVWHCAVKEEGRVGRDLALAPPLTVEPLPGRGESYDDLDELDARFVSPLAGALRALCAHRKWRGGGNGQRPVSWEEAKEMLIAERRHSATVPYLLAADERRPGAFYIGSLTSNTPRREFFVALPDGFYFRKKVYSTVDALLAAFKKNPRPPTAEHEARPAPAAAAPAAQYAAPQEGVYAPYAQYAQQQYQQWHGQGGGYGAYGATVPDQFGQGGAGGGGGYY